MFGHEGRIYVVDAGGSELVSLSGSFEPLHVFSDTNDLDFSPSVSPDGSRVVYSTLRYAKGRVDYGSKEHDYEIATMTIDGRDRRRLTDNERHDVAPVWSPAGSHIAFLSGPGNHRRLFVITLDGSEGRYLAPALKVADQPPVWSPDGSRLAFLALQRRSAEIPYVDTQSDSTPESQVWEGTITRYSAYTIRPDGSELTRLEWVTDRPQSPRPRGGPRDLREPEEYVGGLTWSPDGSRLAFAANFYGEPPGLYSIDAEGAGLWLLFPGSGTTEMEEETVQGIVPRFSDDSSVQFQVTSRGVDEERTVVVVSRVFVVDVDSPEPRLLRKEQGYWPPSSEWPAPSGARSVFLTGPSGREAHVILSGGPGGQPEQRKPFVISVDGRLEPANPVWGDDSPDSTHCAGVSAIKSGESRSLTDDHDVLLCMRDILAGSAVLYWTSDRPITEWPGVVVSGSPPRVQEIRPVPGMPLTGTIPPELGTLAGLKVLDLGNNELHGEIPPELSRLKNLEQLYLGPGNSLTGSIPPELGSLNRLRILDLRIGTHAQRATILAGEIPLELGNLRGLEELYIRGSITGPIPPELGNLENLRVLDLWSFARMSGDIPSALGNLAELEVLKIGTGGMSGGIPVDLANLPNLRELHLDGNGSGLSGTIPPELANAPNLTKLNLRRNQLEGAIPREMERFVEDSGDGSFRVQLSYVNLLGNRLTGCVPANWEYIWELHTTLPFCR